MNASVQQEERPSPPLPAAWAVFLLGLFLLLPGITSETGITGQDEYALTFRTPMETMETGQWLTPWLNGEPRLKKPPLVYWAIFVTYKMLGISLFSARIWGVLAGAGLAALTCLIHRQLFGRSGLLAGLIALASLGLAVDGRRAMLDIPLAFFVTLAVYLALRWGRSGRWPWILGAAAALGLGFLTKGPPAWIFFGAAAVTALACFRRWSFAAARWPALVSAAAVTLALSLWWPLLMARLWPQYIAVLRGDARTLRLGEFYAPFSAFGGSLGLVLPWTFVLLAALAAAVRRRRTLDAPRAWLLAWYAAGILPFFFMKSFERYLQPILPAQCILCAAWLEDAAAPARRMLLRVTAVALSLLVVALSLFFLWFKLAAPAALAGLVLVGVLLATAFRADRPRTVAFVAAMIWAFLLGGLYPALGVNGLPAGIEDMIGDTPVATYGSPQPSMLSMRIRRSPERIKNGDAAALREFWRRQGLLFVAVPYVPSFNEAARPITYAKVYEYRTFYSRAAWIRFARRDATADDWRQAFRTRSLENLKTPVYVYRLPAR